MSEATLTAAKPPILDKIAAAVAALIALAAALGWIPAVAVTPEQLVGALGAIVALVAGLRAQREGKAAKSTAELVSGLVAEIAALKHAAPSPAPAPSTVRTEERPA